MKPPTEDQLPHYLMNDDDSIILDLSDDDADDNIVADLSDFNPDYDIVRSHYEKSEVIDDVQMIVKGGGVKIKIL
ncbi:hypothetical protein JTB14_003524 [Gonioctena quinquepunctata]|nr:hypothetical protein JTB14_003524 [Gonioctena quinquepunctata]